MIRFITKRDGRHEEFQAIKIANAIMRAMEKVGEPSWRMASTIANKISKLDKEEITVEECQDLVEDALMRSSNRKVAQEYIRYRHKRNLQRKANRYHIFDDISTLKSTEVTKENANMAADTPSGQLYKFASETTKEYAKDALIDEEFVQAHDSGSIHIHDLDWYPTKSLTCVHHPLDHMFKGFTANHATARAPKRIETAAILACISLQTAQNEFHGGQAIPAFDFYMAPYVKLTFEEELKYASALMGLPETPSYSPIKDYTVTDLSLCTNSAERVVTHAINQTVFRVHQAMESFVHNLCTMHSRGGRSLVAA